MTHAYCMTSSFSEGLIRKPYNTTACPFLIDKNNTLQSAH